MAAGRVAVAVATMVHAAAAAVSVRIPVRNRTNWMRRVWKLGCGAAVAVVVFAARRLYHRRPLQDVAAASVRSKRTNTLHFRHLICSAGWIVVVAAVVAVLVGDAGDGATERHRAEYADCLPLELADLRLAHTTYRRMVDPGCMILFYGAGHHFSDAVALCKLLYSLDHLPDSSPVRVSAWYETLNRPSGSMPIRPLWAHCRLHRTGTDSRSYPGSVHCCRWATRPYHADTSVWLVVPVRCDLFFGDAAYLSRPETE